MEDELVLNTEYWRNKAKKTKEAADRHIKGSAKNKMLLHVAQEYEKLARRQALAGAAEQPLPSRSMP